MRNEQKYEFRKRLLNIHRKDVRNFDILPDENELELKNGVNIIIPEKSEEVMITGAKDFTDYLFTSMKVSAMISNEKISDNFILCSVNEKQTEDYIINIGDSISISGKNARGVAQAFYCLEDRMNVKKAPILKKEIIRHTFLFSPRMVHSGYGIDNYPNEHLASIAHAGMDAILVFVKGINMTSTGFVDFNELIYRASRYGIDVYAYSYLKSEKHPEEEDAQDFYDNLYGTLFKACPGLKGVILVGESVGFPSKDKNVSLNGKLDKDGFPTGKPAPGWWPCYDYPQWLDCVKKAVRKQKEDADIVFWTYNWGYVDKEHRLKLINSLPTDITLMATFEMFESYKIGEISEFTADYTLSLHGPGKYFASEAEAAKKRGIRMYTMANTGGTTWDMGVVPYEPMPYQWMKRYKHDFWSYSFEDSNIVFRNKDKSGYEYRKWWLKVLRDAIPADGYLQTGCDIVMGNPFLGEYFTNYRYGIDIGDGNWENVKTNYLWGMACFSLHTGDLFVPNSDSVGMLPGLSDDEAYFCINYCLVTHSMVEIAGLLSKAEHNERYRMLKKAVCNPNNGQDIFFAAYDYRKGGYNVPEIIYFKTPHFSRVKNSELMPVRTVGIFNLSEEIKTYTLNAQMLGLDSEDYILTDVWSGESFDLVNAISFNIRPHASLLLAVSKNKGLQLYDANIRINSVKADGHSLLIETDYAVNSVELSFSEKVRSIYLDGESINFKQNGNSVLFDANTAGTLKISFEIY